MKHTFFVSYYMSVEKQGWTFGNSTVDAFNLNTLEGRQQFKEVYEKQEHEGYKISSIIILSFQEVTN